MVKWNPDLQDFKTQLGYQRMLQKGFISGWQLSPLGTTSWITVEGDDKATQ
jgi:hypothetical protein